MPKSNTNERAVRALTVCIVSMGMLILGLVIMRGFSSHAEFPALGAKSLPMRPVTSTDHVQGSLDAPIKLIVYFDLECIYCKSLHEKTLPALKKRYGDAVAVVYRNFPLPSRPRAFPEAEGAECAYSLGGDKAFWAFVDRIYTVTPSENKLDPAQVPKTAKVIGLDTEAFKKCQAEEEGKSRVMADIEDGSSIDLTITPSIAIVRGNDFVIVAGDYPSRINTAIEYLRALP